MFRVGGDEFTVILQNDDYRNRADLVDSFEKRAAEISATRQNRWEQVHVSIGIAVYDPKEDRCINDTVRRADKTMYTNKRKHKTGSADGR